MPQHPNEPTDGHRHVSVEPCPGYYECEHCGHRWIDVDVLPSWPPSTEIVNWLHHNHGPRTLPLAPHTVKRGVIAAEYGPLE
jgi:hypothetical protein